MDGRGLTRRQARFLELLVGGVPQGEAAVLAGYSAGTCPNGLKRKLLARGDVGEDLRAALDTIGYHPRIGLARLHLAISRIDPEYDKTATDAVRVLHSITGLQAPDQVRAVVAGDDALIDALLGRQAGPRTINAGSGPQADQ